LTSFLSVASETESIRGLLIQQQNQNRRINTLDPSLDQLPEPLIEALIRYTTTSSSSSASSTSVNEISLERTKSPKLLPIQQKSYTIISKGDDAVLFSPTGTGKSLGFILPLAARILQWQQDGSYLYRKAAQKQHFIRQSRNNNNGNDSLSSSSSSQVDAATPSILIIEPSRELARQVGKVFEKFHPTTTSSNGAKGSSSSKRQVVTVYGGVPMTRHAALLSSKTNVVVGTPGRIRELIRENYLSTKYIRSIVLDEADTLLNFADNPEVEWLLDGMTNDYQLILASATINKRVEKFVSEVMELEVGEEGYLVVDTPYGDDDHGGLFTNDDDITIDGKSEKHLDDVDMEVGQVESSGINTAYQLETPTVRHWSMPSSPASRITLTSDLLITLAPRRGIVFVPTKAEVESVAQELSERLSANDVSIHILHGDMVQQARSRTIRAFRDDSARIITTRILIATDVAARGLDLPAIDLVLQYGVPRKTGKDGTYDSELYIHRTGRAGRFGNTRSADAIVLYDRTQGESTTLNKLREEMKDLHSIVIMPRQLPSPSEVMDASYERVMRLCTDFGTGTPNLVRYFAGKLSDEMKANNGGETTTSSSSDNAMFLIHRLATAMASLSGLDDVVPPRSLLTADPGDRTIRVWSDSCDANNPLSPSEVTKLVKSLGSGKLGKISTCEDGSVVFDLGSRKAELLLESAAANDDTKLVESGWHFEIPVSLPTLILT
jgi:superfamily II DNA/RNA helicase